jgi:membrane protein implicated in regulation of membrane protease activity
MPAAWVWIVGGVALAALEVLVPAYVFLGFAIGAVATGVLVWLGVLGGDLSVGLMAFALASLAAWLALRRALGRRKGQIKIWKRDVNDQ